ncbi:hypothetical protein [Falsirhodobacter sp. 1013]|uniref:hypothetical protein n=1 Tax=Falsirhodobacter sp. 1013 TaxID=3417566 RepID=UPI003EBB3CC4
MNDDALLAALGVEFEASSITDLKHVPSASEREAAEEVASRQRGEDFDTFKPLLE